MKATELLCYLNFAEACMVHTALLRELKENNLTAEAKAKVREFVEQMEDKKHGVYTVQSVPAHQIVP